MLLSRRLYSFTVSTVRLSSCLGVHLFKPTTARFTSLFFNFLLISWQIQWHIVVVATIKYRRWCTWDSNPGRQKMKDARCRWIHWAMAVFINRGVVLCCAAAIICSSNDEEALRFKAPKKKKTKKGKWTKEILKNFFVSIWSKRKSFETILFACLLRVDTLRLPSLEASLVKFLFRIYVGR